MTEQELLKQLEKRITKEYKDTEAVIREKILYFTKDFDKENKKYQQMVKDGLMSQKDYKNWYKNQMFAQKWSNKMVSEISSDLVKTTETASKIINNDTSKVYLQGLQEGVKELEPYDDFTVFDTRQIKKIADENAKHLPKANPNIPKEERWNEKRIRSALMQSAIKGESVQKLAGRLRVVVGMGRTSAIRNARTMMTASHNMGKLDLGEEALEMGIQVRKKWIATFDNRTRDSHALLHGEVVDMDEEFSNGLMYPADPDGDPAEVYNCRCTMALVQDEEKTEGMSEEEFKERVEENEARKEEFRQANRELKEQNAKPQGDVSVNYGNAVNAMNDSLLSASTDYASRMGGEDVRRFNSIFEKAEYETSGASSYDKLNNVIGIAKDGEEGTTVFHESTHWYDYNQNYTLVDDYGHIKYNTDDDGNLLSKEWIPEITTIKENAGFSEYIAWEWDKYEFNRDTFKVNEFSKSQLDLQNFVKKVGTSDTYGYGRESKDLEKDMQAITDYLKLKNVSKADSDYVHLSDFISAISYDANLGSLTTGGHDYNYWARGSEQRVTEIVAGYNLLRATGREDLINIERDLAPNLMKMIEEEWSKIW